MAGPVNREPCAAGFQIAAVTGLLLHYPWLGVSMHDLGLGLLLIATALTLWSGYDYFAAYLGGGGGGRRCKRCAVRVVH